MQGDKVPTHDTLRPGARCSVPGDKKTALGLVQMAGVGGAGPESESIHAAAAEGIQSSGESLPFKDSIPLS